MKKLIWLPVAGFLMIAGAAVAAAAPSLVDDARGLLNPSQADSGTITVDGVAHAHPGDDLLIDVLADLVSNGTITQAQSDAITDALQAKVDEQIAEMEARREEMRQTMESLQTFLEDGTITQDEINTLPEDNPLREVFDSIATDGSVTLEQLQNLGPGFGFGFGHAEMGGPSGRGHGGPGLWMAPVPNDADPNASPSSDSSSN